MSPDNPPDTRSPRAPRAVKDKTPFRAATNPTIRKQKLAEGNPDLMTADELIEREAAIRWLNRKNTKQQLAANNSADESLSLPASSGSTSGDLASSSRLHVAGQHQLPLDGVSPLANKGGTNHRSITANMSSSPTPSQQPHLLPDFDPLRNLRDATTQAQGQELFVSLYPPKGQDKVPERVYLSAPFKTEAPGLVIRQAPGIIPPNVNITVDSIGVSAHRYEHQHGHQHEHQHEHQHGHQHEHEHEHQHEHQHEHEHEHQHEHQHEHEHEHQHGHQHEHQHGHQHEHEHEHQHEHQHEHEHEHQHEHQHEHEHEHQHEHQHGHQHAPGQLVGGRQLSPHADMPDAGEYQAQELQGSAPLEAALEVGGQVEPVPVSMQIDPVYLLIAMGLAAALSLWRLVV